MEDEEEWNILEVDLSIPDHEMGTHEHHHKDHLVLDFKIVNVNNSFSFLQNIYQECYNSFRIAPANEKFSTEPCWLLGECFSQNIFERKENSMGHVTRFKESVQSQFLWFTYRRDFPVIPAYNCTSDAGWGCTLRSGQMLLARAFNSIYKISRIDDCQTHNPLHWFLDNDASPYSIHNFVSESASIFGIHQSTSIMYNGEWFGPSQFSQIAELLVQRAHPNIVFHIPFANCVYIDRVLELCQSFASTTITTSSSSSAFCSEEDYEESWKPLLIMIPTLLGPAEKINRNYIPHLKALLSSAFCTGIIAGREKASVYIIGYQEENVIYLDPHHVQNSVSLFTPNILEVSFILLFLFLSIFISFLSTSF
eukprot:TRINITY_DN3191_c0_g1_i1.p1 TRINITY_DN3191_c0_g1~~TRINITY_DN3191_c0_g1_i1.p1  ORF type:complete len:377 (-),score=28.29 TRINITY_DN3191_c0_g1_i1:316-1413(-)